MRRMRAVGPLVLATSLALAASACFLGYDSRWGEAKRAQQRLAASSDPAGITPADPAPETDAGRRTWRVRVRPDGAYLAQNLEAPRQVADLLDDASRVLGPSIALDLVLDRLQPWAFEEDDRLERALSALQHDDEGKDVDLVVGMIGSLPRQTDSLHQEGMATLLGKYVVVRGASRAGELDAIDRTFNELPEEERARLLKQRKRHRALAVLLHEIGHCLGALHETEPGSLMAPAYSTRMAGFGDGAIALMRAAAQGEGRSEVARAQLALLENGPGGSWIPAERAAAIAQLHALLPTGRSAAPSTNVASLPAGAPPELDAEAQQRFTRAQQYFLAGAVAPAYETARPLFAAYPNVYAVQDLRCQLATVRWLPQNEMLAECAPVGRLAADAAAPASARATPR